MKKILKDSIINIENTELFDNSFLFDYLEINPENSEITIIHISDLLEERKNEEILKRVNEKPAMYSNVYSPEDELEIFKELFDNAIKNNKKIHIIWVTLAEEIKILEEYYSELWFMREDINCFDPDFNVPLVTVLSPPKSIAQTAGSPVAVSLKIKQPLAVNEADVQEMLAKSQTAVLEDRAGVTLVRAFPFAE